MLPIAPYSAAGSWKINDALRRCASARERVDSVIAELRAIDDGCVWKARAVDLLRRELKQRGEDLFTVQSMLGATESDLQMPWAL